MPCRQRCSSATAVKTSGVFAPPMTRNSGPQQEPAADKDDGDGSGGSACDVVPRDVIRHGLAGEQRHQCDQRDECEVLEQQALAKRVTSGRRCEQVALGQHRQHDGGGRHRKSSAQHDRPRPCDAVDVRQRGNGGGGDHQLCRSKAEYGAPHHPKSLRAQFEADEEQQHHHAEAGDAGDVIDVGDQAQARGADDDAGEQIAEHAAEACTPCQRHGDGRSGEQYDEGGQHYVPPPPSPASRGGAELPLPRSGEGRRGI